MQLSWSHAVLYVKDESAMLDFYTNVLGFEVTDRGKLGPEDGPSVIFLSQQADEHHQIAMMTSRREDGPSNSVNHFAFRVADFEDIANLNKTLGARDGVRVNPISHGNTLSLYFNDSEGNGIEVFWDTPWHVAQPQGRPWDTALGKERCTRLGPGDLWRGADVRAA